MRSLHVGGAPNSKRMEDHPRSHHCVLMASFIALRREKRIPAEERSVGVARRYPRCQEWKVLKILVVVIVISVASSTWSCARLWGPGSGQKATVTLNDGSTFNGTITSSSSSSISLRAANGEARIIPTSQVESVQYGGEPTVNAPAGHPAN